tara:strand:- start:153 stop:1157 length:1005 start_codon:yes stop_codon:yes gene_type:complete
MSKILEQAIVDAEALKEVALKNAEATILEKYSDKIKEAVETLLEQEEQPQIQEEEISMVVKDQIPLAATDGETACPCPDKEEDVEVVIDFDELSKNMEDEGEEVDGRETDEEAAEEIMGLAEEIEIDEEALEEELEVEELDLESIVEKLTVDIVPQNDGWAGSPSREEYEFAEKELLALEQDTEVKEEMAAMRKAVKKLQEEKNTLQSKNSELNDKLKEVAGLFGSLKENVAETSLVNARLLYTNKVLGDASLNERQRIKIVESISKADSVEEAKIIYETLLSSVGSAAKQQPKSLSEAVNKTTSTLLLNRQKDDKKYDPSTERWKILAGLNNN